MGKNKILVLLSVLIVAVYITVDFFIQNKNLMPEEKIEFKLKSISIPDIKKYISIKVDNDYLGEFELWRYRRPEVKKKEKKEERNYVIYQVRKIGKRQAIINPQDRRDIWEFYGVFLVGKKRFAIFFNKNLREHKYRIVTSGDRLTEDLIIDKITSKKIFVKFPVRKNKYQTLELNVFYVDIEKFKKKMEEESKK